MRPKNAILLIVAGLLIALIPVMPHGYYRVMRWVVCAACISLAIAANEGKQTGWIWCWGILAGIYNPIFPVAAMRSLWSLINLATLVISALYWKVVSSNRKETASDLQY